MNFAQQEQFTAKKAGGLGAVVLLHLLLAGGLVYGLHSTIVTRDHHTEATLYPFKPFKPVVDHTDEVKTKIKSVKREIDQIDLPPVPEGGHERTGEHPPGPTTGAGHTDGPGQGSTIDNGGGGGEATPYVKTSSPVLSNLDSCKPNYPLSALKSEQEGVVRVRFEIGADNRLLSTAVIKSSGYTALDRAAVEGLSKCSFKAATQDGTPVRSSLVTDYVWSLN